MEDQLIEILALFAIGLALLIPAGALADWLDRRGKE